MKLKHGIFWGPAPKRRDRTHHRKPLALWREKMARMEHRAQLKRWWGKPVTRKQYAAVKAALATGVVDHFVGFEFVKTALT